MFQFFPPKINDPGFTVPTATLWKKAFGKKKSWRMALSYLIILAVILAVIFLPPFIGSLF